MLLSNGLHHSENLPVKFGFSPKIVPANIVQKLLSQRCFQPFLIAFSTSRTNGPRSLLQAKAGTHTRLSEKDRTQGLTRRNRWYFGWGRCHYPQTVSHVRKPPRAGYQNGKLCRFGGLVKGAPEEHRKPAEQRCAYARRCSAGVAAPLGCAALFAIW